MHKQKNGKGFWINIFRNFFLPEINKKFIVRLSITGTLFFLIFLLFKPCFISGSSMEPAYHDNSFTFSFRWRYMFSPPCKGDVVTVSYFGRRELLKRVVGLPGDQVQFRSGKLFVNGSVVVEPYVVFECDWESDPVIVREGHCFVVGDNRSQLKEEHICGEVSMERITGGVLF